MDKVRCAIHRINNPCWVVSQSKMLSFHRRFFTNEAVDKHIKQQRSQIHHTIKNSHIWNSYAKLTFIMSCRIFTIIRHVSVCKLHILTCVTCKLVLTKTSILYYYDNTIKSTSKQQEYVDDDETCYYL